MKSKNLADHMIATYITIRIGMAVLGIALPFVLWIGGHLRSDLPLQQSMSAYYHAGGGAMRDEFVGLLFALGVLLYLYRGYTTLENFALNLAGIFVVGVALIPMQWGCGTSCSKVSLHGTAAVLFFLSIAYVCVFRASDTLALMSDRKRAMKFARTYRALGTGMVLSPAFAVILSIALQPLSPAKSTVFFVEALGTFVFASYWIVKSREIVLSNLERSAVEGRLKTRQIRAADAFKEILVERVAGAAE